MTSPSQQGEGPSDPLQANAARSMSAHLRLWLTAVLVLILDLWSKHWIFTHLHPDETVGVIPRTFVFQRQLNDGAVFGSLTGMVGLFVVASIFALGFVLVLFASSNRKQRVLHLALGLILAGALGNLYDRGFVRADVAVFNSGFKVIGKVLENPDPQRITIGYWPDGHNARPYDREDLAKLTTQGVVRDFIKFMPRFPRWVPRLGGKDIWPWVFNVADSALVVGVGLLLVCFLAERRRPHPAHAADAKEQPSAAT
jgi:lipoprotein signal peptidase